MNIFTTIFSKEIKRQVRAALKVSETDLSFIQGAGNSQQRDRYPYDRMEVMTQALEAWRINPLARRVIELTSQYVVGGGLSFECKNQYVAKFLNKFWDHRLNHMAIRVTEWCDELSRTGNLFVLLSTDAAGMSYVRAIPATQVKEIHSRPNDIEQAEQVTVYVSGYEGTVQTQGLAPEEVAYPVYDDTTDTQSENGSI